MIIIVIIIIILLIIIIKIIIIIVNITNESNLIKQIKLLMSFWITLQNYKFVYSLFFT